MGVCTPNGFLRGCQMEKFGALWSNKGTQEPDAGFTPSNAKEEACVRCTVD